MYDTTEHIIENNQVHLRGKMVTGFSFSHELLGEGFYTAQVTVDRLSEMTDTIPILVSERLIDVTQDYIGKYVEIRGQFRSYNQYNEKHNRLILHVFATKMEILEEEDYPINEIYLDGYICKPTVFRKTPLDREIADVLLAVNRPYKKSIISPVSAGEEMLALQIPWTLGIICRSRAVSRAENTLNGLAKQKRKAALHMRFQQAA